jgi:hypothetical protein
VSKRVEEPLYIMKLAKKTQMLLIIGRGIAFDLVLFL